MKFILIAEAKLKNLMRLKKSLREDELAGILEGIGVYMVSSVRKNFEEGGRPKLWKELKKETLKRKRGTKTLVESGMLSGGILSEVAPSERAVYIGPSGPASKYARRHKYGDIGGEPIPQRDFLLMQDEDSEYIDTFIRVSMF
jgi:phage virion morphogenesis protein